jgi:hypothetical protein
LQEGRPINKERGNLFSTPLEELKVKIKIEEQLTVLKIIRGSSSN